MTVARSQVIWPIVIYLAPMDHKQDAFEDIFIVWCQILPPILPNLQENNQICRGYKFLHPQIHYTPLFINSSKTPCTAIIMRDRKGNIGIWIKNKIYFSLKLYNSTKIRFKL